MIFPKLYRLQRNHNQNREDLSFSRPWSWAHFLDGRNAAASIAPSLFQLWAYKIAHIEMLEWCTGLCWKGRHVYHCYVIIVLSFVALRFTASQLKMYSSLLTIRNWDAVPSAFVYNQPVMVVNSTCSQYSFLFLSSDNFLG